ncbi:hypothetical protein BDK51DRAFT_36800 [Blyttiomyces helicus]|uniref:Rab-GAP TBC domain-containing protein n=1 Tax=Blyttiomyces helicus TaxID=388810 RepID=A0A4P9WJH8_9FUNG|nr:hypothetical protein BDK51DRAFT_36800 [Blyttiomyces helicus]|eukprot:RKO91290.1 hypothetical protein BDK51DRAFT_36800 [Blyttiomyces helicus]
MLLSPSRSPGRQQQHITNRNIKNSDNHSHQISAQQLLRDPLNSKFPPEDSLALSSAVSRRTDSSIELDTELDAPAIFLKNVGDRLSAALSENPAAPDWRRLSLNTDYPDDGEDRTSSMVSAGFEDILKRIEDVKGDPTMGPAAVALGFDDDGEAGKAFAESVFSRVHRGGTLDHHETAPSNRSLSRKAKVGALASASRSVPPPASGRRSPPSSPPALASPLAISPSTSPARLADPPLQRVASHRKSSRSKSSPNASSDPSFGVDLFLADTFKLSPLLSDSSLDYFGLADAGSGRLAKRGGGRGSPALSMRSTPEGSLVSFPTTSPTGSSAGSLRSLPSQSAQRWPLPITSDTLMPPPPISAAAMLDGTARVQSLGSLVNPRPPTSRPRPSMDEPRATSRRKALDFQRTRPSMDESRTATSLRSTQASNLPRPSIEEPRSTGFLSIFPTPRSLSRSSPRPATPPPPSPPISKPPSILTRSSSRRSFDASSRRSTDKFFEFVDELYSRVDAYGFVVGVGDKTRQEKAVEAAFLAKEKERFGKWQGMVNESRVNPVVQAAGREVGQGVVVAAGGGVPPKVALAPVFTFYRNSKFRSRLEKGIPQTWRGHVWYDLITSSSGLLHRMTPDQIGKMDAGFIRKYHELQSQTSFDEHQIALDVPRTFGNHIGYMQRRGPGALSLRSRNPLHPGDKQHRRDAADRHGGGGKAPGSISR